MAEDAGTPVSADSIRAARAASAAVIRHTPVLSSRTLSERCGGEVVLKAENLQRTGSFKLRGALGRLARLGRREAEAGVVAGSAGNHAQSLAYAARARGVPCTVFMPAGAPIAKVEAAAGLGARVETVEGPVDNSIEAAHDFARREGATFVHPFDDPDVIAGQGTLGLELLEDVSRLALVVVPVGGGGLVSGLAVAVKEALPEVEVIGVQARACAAFPASLRDGVPVRIERGRTICDGIAVEQPGELTLALVRRWVDGIATVAEDEVSEAMVDLMERAKLVVEGAGAVGVAALLSGAVTPAAEGQTCVILSGGNVDPGLLAEAVRHHESVAGRRLVLLTRVPDQPGGLARLLDGIAAEGANLVTVDHVREGLDLHVRESAVQLVLETRGRDHAERVVEACRGAGYEVRVLT